MRRTSAALWLGLLLGVAPFSAYAQENPELTFSQDPPQLIVFGVDAATPQLMDLLIEEGSLPNFQRLTKEGASGRLQTLEPIFSPMIWTTVATGRMPEDHGITGFTWADTEATWLQPTSSSQRKVPALWNLTSAMGYTAVVSGWPVSWPAEEVNGFVISNYFFMPESASQIDQITDPKLGALFPPALGEEIAPFVVGVEDISERMLARNRLQGLADVPVNITTFAKDLTFFNSAKHLLETKSPDVLMVYIQGTDVLGHTRWPMLEYYLQHSRGIETSFVFDPETLEPSIDEDGPQSPLSQQQHEKLMEQGRLIINYYQLADKWLGELLDIEPDRPRVVCVLSDHGFGRIGGDVLIQTADAAYTKPLAWHLPSGIIILQGNGIAEGKTLEGASVKDVFPTLAHLLKIPLAENLAGRLLEDAFIPGYLEANPAVTIPQYEYHKEASEAPVVSSEQRQKLLEELQSLGYIR